jgi:hypothetical protein
VSNASSAAFSAEGEALEDEVDGFCVVIFVSSQPQCLADVTDQAGDVPGEQVACH